MVPHPQRHRLLADEGGAITPLALLFFSIFLMAGGLALDMSHHVAARTQLQAAVDSAAHAALVSRRRHDEATARAIALDLLHRTMPPERFGQRVVDPGDIEFGRWLRDAGQWRFVPDPDIQTAVRVRGARVESRGNALRTVLLRTVGVNTLDLSAQAVFTTYQPICIEEGFVAEGKVDVQSNNEYLRGFCIHSNDYVRINQNNYFEEGTIVSMPDLDLLDIPNSGFERNEGLEMALREGELDIRILRELDEVIASVRAGEDDHRPGYVESTIPVERNFNRNNNQLGPEDFTAGRIHDYRCVGQNQRITIPNGTLLQGVVLVTDCRVDLGGGTRLEDVMILSTNTRDDAISGASGVNIGRDDDCAPGGGAQIITLGSMRFPANLGIFGGQLIAAGDIDFAARANGVQGASLIAGGQIDGTSNSSMSRCNSGMEGNVTSPYYRLAR